MLDWKKMALLMVAGFVLTSCGPKKEENAPEKEPVAQPQVEQKEMPQPQQTPEVKPLTPQEEELKIDEENVMETFPG